MQQAAPPWNEMEKFWFWFVRFWCSQHVFSLPSQRTSLKIGVHSRMPTNQSVVVGNWWIYILWSWIQADIWVLTIFNDCVLPFLEQVFHIKHSSIIRTHTAIVTFSASAVMSIHMSISCIWHGIQSCYLVMFSTWLVNCHCTITL